MRVATTGGTEEGKACERGLSERFSPPSRLSWTTEPGVYIFEGRRDRTSLISSRDFKDGD